jgi:glycosyltransferase involved in cell wall biosynthesis
LSIWFAGWPCAAVGQLADEHHERGLRVALVLATSAGGVGRHVASLAEGLAGAGHRVVVFGPATTEQRFGFSRCGGNGTVRFRAVEIGTTSNPLTAAVAAARLRQLTRGADVVHAHGLRAAGIAAAACARWRPPRGRRSRRGPVLVVTLHNAMMGGRSRRILAGTAMRRVAAVADVVLAVSPDLLAQLRPAVPAVQQALVAAPLRTPSRDRGVTRRALGVGADRPLVLAVGRLHPQKGFDVLVAAAARVRAPGQDSPGQDSPGQGVCVVIAGDGPARPGLATAIERAGVDVRLLGDRHDVADLLRASDVVAMPSRWEGWPLAAGEALAAGVPLVASRVGGLPDLVGDAALLVPPGDAGALAAGLTRVLADRKFAASLAAAGRRRAAELPTGDDVMAQVVASYATARASR